MAWINLLDVIYPIGSLYFSNEATSPASIVGGSWTRIEEAAIRSGDTVGYMGADEHTISITEMPKHRHKLSYNGGVVGWQGSSPSMYATWDNYNSMDTNKKWWDFFDSYTGANGKVHPISDTGGGQEMSLVQRSYNCYIWYRTA